MKREDRYWCAGYCLIGLFSVILFFTGAFVWFNGRLPYVAGFVQFAVYATAGELLSTRMLEARWEVNRALLFKAVCWGLSGMVMTATFCIYSGGVVSAMDAGLLPFRGSRLARAFYASSASNLLFGPIHSAFIRVCGNYADHRCLTGGRWSRRQAVSSVDWGELVDFTLFKTIPFFWIPVNTLVFLLPQDCRIPLAAMLSMVFGILMSMLRLRERRRLSAGAAG